MIPWRGSTAQFENTLVSVLANRPANTEVIVVHRGVYDDPYELRREVLLVEHDEDAGLSDLLGRGLEVAGGDLLHVLSCGTTVEEGWTDSVWRHFEDERVASATPLILQQADPRRLHSAGVALTRGGRRRELGRGRRVDSAPSTAWGPSLHGAFYRPSALRAVGGFAAAAATGELLDADIAASLRQAGFTHALARECRLQADPHLGHPEGEEAETLDLGVAAGQRERLYWRHSALLGWSGLAVHAVEATVSLIGSTLKGRLLSELRGRGGAALKWSEHRRHQRLLADAEIEPAAPSSIPLEERRGRSQDRRRAA